MVMNCSEADAIMYAFVDGELSGSDRTAYEAHLVSCDTCAHATRLQSRSRRPCAGICRGQKFRRGAPAPPRCTSSRAHGATSVALAGLPRIFTLGHRSVGSGRLVGASRGAAPRPPVLEQALSTFHHDVPLDVLSQSCAAVTDWFRASSTSPCRRRQAPIRRASGRPAGGMCASALVPMLSIRFRRPPSGADGVSSRR